jgi:pentatricopeptide repeat protein
MILYSCILKPYNLPVQLGCMLLWAFRSCTYLLSLMVLAMMRRCTAAQEELHSLSSVLMCVYMCAQLLDAMSQAGMGPDREAQLAALRVCAKAGSWNAALRIWEKLQGRGTSGPQPADAAAAELVVEACRAGNNPQKASELAAQYAHAGLVTNRGGSRPSSSPASRTASMASSAR